MYSLNDKCVNSDKTQIPDVSREGLYGKHTSGSVFIITKRPVVMSAQRTVPPNSSNSANTAKWQFAADFTTKQLNKAFDLKSAKKQSANEECNGALGEW